MRVLGVQNLASIHLVYKALAPLDSDVFDSKMSNMFGFFVHCHIEQIFCSSENAFYLHPLPLCLKWLLSMNA